MAGFASLLGLMAAVPAANAVPVVFTGVGASGGAGQGIIGNAFVARASIAHMNTFYANNGVAGPYTELSSPDAFDFTNGDFLTPGTNPPPARQFAATAAASPTLAGFGINGPLHIGISTFTLDFNNTSDLFTTSATSERRIYRNGTAKIFEETAPNVFVELASYTGGIFTVDIDYTTGLISNVFTGTREAGSNTIFPELWTGTSANPIDVAGSTSDGSYGTFDVTTTLDIGADAIPEPGGLVILLSGLLVLGAVRRVRR